MHNDAFALRGVAEANEAIHVVCMMFSFFKFRVSEKQGKNRVDACYSTKNESNE